MRDKPFFVSLPLCLALCLSAANAPSADLQSFTFERDFEDDAALDIKPTAANGKYKVNFMGVTDEKAFAGKKSFKLDITAESGTYYSWLIPLKARLDGALKLSCRYQVKSSGKGAFGPGVAWCFPAIPFDGQEFFDWKSSTEDGWNLVEIDLIAFAKRHISHNGWEVDDERLMGYLKGVVLVIRSANPGENVTVYLDNLRIDGMVPEIPDDFKRLAEEKWQPVKDRQLSQINRLKKQTDNDRLCLSTFANPAPTASYFMKMVEANVATSQSLVANADKRGYLLSKEVKTHGQLQERTNDLLSNIAMLSDSKSPYRTFLRDQESSWWHFW